MKSKVTFQVNGKQTTIEANGMTRLLDILREDLQYTGTKEGCGEGECGACSVLINGKLVNSCLVPIVQVDGATIETIENLSMAGLLNAIQDAFLKFGGAQCGMCTPGMIMATKDLLSKNKNPNEIEIRQALSGNLCRCTGYTKIIDSVVEASKKLSSGAGL